ncbi:MAG: peptidoglycan recognition family protein [bacterium]
MKIIKKPLPATEYNKLEYDQYGMKTKTLIVLHHTVSSTESSVYNWWCNDGQKVGVAYVVDKNGSIYEYFGPKYWSYHLGGKIEKKYNINSIGIEIVNEGVLKKIDEKFFWFAGKNKYSGGVFKFKWRNEEYWAEYPTKQIEAVVELVKYLTAKFNIPKNVYTKYDYNSKLLTTFKGIISHCNVRANKTDISPAFNLEYLQNEILK